MTINVTELHRELERAGIPIEGVASDGRIDFRPEATQAQRDQAAQILAAHDPAKLAQEEVERQAKLEAARAENAEPIDPTIADGQDAVIQLLVKKIAWLEQEIHDLRGSGN